MRRWSLCIGALLLVVGCAVTPKVQVEPQQTPIAGHSDFYRIATWNVRNLFDDIDDSYQDETPNSDQYKQKVGEVAQVIETLEADFIALQEIENLEALQRVNALLPVPYPQVGLLEGNDQIRGIDVAFLSRIPVTAVRSHARENLPKQPGDKRNHRFSRDCLEVHLASEPPVVLLINHLKSARNDSKKSASKRRAQSEGVVRIASELEHPLAVVALGDFNDVPDSWATEPLFAHFTDPLSGLPHETRITHRYKKGGSALDHILLDPEAVSVAGPARIWPDVALQTSDHNPVSIELKLKVGGETPEEVWDQER